MINIEICTIAKNTHSYWVQPEKPIFHHIISLLTSQKVRFAVGRAMRIRLYNRVPNGIITPESLSMLTRKELSTTIGFSDNQISVIESLLKINNYDDIDSLITIRGIGPWTIKGAKLLSSVKIDSDNGELIINDKHIVLYEDKYIRKRVGELFNMNYEPTQEQVMSIFETHWKGYETLMSYFLWRIKDSGINKLKIQEPLTKFDFL